VSSAEDKRGSPASSGKPAATEEANMRKVLQVASSGGTFIPGMKLHQTAVVGSSVAGKSNDVLVSQLYNPGFTISNSDLCLPRHNSSAITLLIIITTAPGNQVLAQLSKNFHSFIHSFIHFFLLHRFI
jgi:hypothetical protein